MSRRPKGHRRQRSALAPEFKFVCRSCGRRVCTDRYQVAASERCIGCESAFRRQQERRQVEEQLDRQMLAELHAIGGL